VFGEGLQSGYSPKLVDKFWISKPKEKLDDHGAHKRKNSNPFYDDLKCNNIDTKGKLKASNFYLILHSFFSLFF
jgi:hypothetical protein